MGRVSSANGAVIGRPVLLSKITKTRLLTGLAVIALASSLAGCREREQGRPLRFAPGVFQGEKAPSLTDNQRKKLHERGYLMR
jgi:hypothetical protein